VYYSYYYYSAKTAKAQALPACVLTSSQYFGKKVVIKTMKKPKICIVGPGVVGQATGKVLLEKGYEVGFLGGREERGQKLRKEGYTWHSSTDLMEGDYDYDITFLTVPTPTHDGKLNFEAMMAASSDLGKRLKKTKKYHLVVVKSTVPPGTTEDIVIKNVEKFSGKKVGKDFGACMNPEYLREYAAYEDILNPWLIIIGEYDKKSGKMLENVYKVFDCPMYRVPLKEAEMQKYVHNLYNASKIAFFNEMREIAKSIGADADKIFKFTAISAEAMWNPKYGIRDMGPFSGACLPKDTKAFYHWATTHKFDARLLGMIIEQNEVLTEKLGMNQYDYKKETNL
jgi:UDPglucose 6-dehydrogenase